MWTTLNTSPGMFCRYRVSEKKNAGRVERPACREWLTGTLHKSIPVQRIHYNTVAGYTPFRSLSLSIAYCIPTFYVRGMEIDLHCYRLKFTVVSFIHVHMWGTVWSTTRLSLKYLD